MFLFPAI